ncbi:unnamed protein product [Chondrus crispus]|uniref:Uncharacterized protein n=1 Tax=Chondrus crispus TaxID=2769 RepID=S0F3L0_CHOCR|nr:unnamed protein product [Chondrus crispus]CDF77499.1 unnamed protein product [Chondrus crispus]|eukprot:XP_005712538.1 unnamed protein product [Chondrus crispus]
MAFPMFALRREQDALVRLSGERALRSRQCRGRGGGGGGQRLGAGAAKWRCYRNVAALLDLINLPRVLLRPDRGLHGKVLDFINQLILIVELIIHSARQGLHVRQGAGDLIQVLVLLAHDVRDALGVLGIILVDLPSIPHGGRGDVLLPPANAGPPRRGGLDQLCAIKQGVPLQILQGDGGGAVSLARGAHALEVDGVDAAPAELLARVGVLARRLDLVQPLAAGLLAREQTGQLGARHLVDDALRLV